MMSFFVSLISFMNAIGTLWIFGLMMLISADVLGREIFNAPIRGVTEIVSLSIVAIVFLQLAHTLWVKRITRNEALLRKLHRASPRIHSFVESIFCLVGGALFGVIAWFSILTVQKSLKVGEYVGAIGDFILPTWPIRLIIVIGSVATCSVFLHRIFYNDKKDHFDT